MKKLLSASAALLLALLILVFSLFRSAEVKFASSGEPSKLLKNRAEGVDIVYQLPYPGNVTPTSVFWPIKAARDRVVLSFQGSQIKTANYLLSLSDKRLGAATHLWDVGDYDDALSVFSKAEIYLSKADEVLEGQGDNDEVISLFSKINLSSLKHRQMLEQVLAESDDQIRPRVTEIMNHCKIVYSRSTARLQSAGRTFYPNPFDN